MSSSTVSKVLDTALRTVGLAGGRNSSALSPLYVKPSQSNGTIVIGDNRTGRDLAIINATPTSAEGLTAEEWAEVFVKAPGIKVERDKLKDVNLILIDILQQALPAMQKMEGFDQQVIQNTRQAINQIWENVEGGFGNNTRTTYRAGGFGSPSDATAPVGFTPAFAGNRGVVPVNARMGSLIVQNYMAQTGVHQDTVLESILVALMYWAKNAQYSDQATPVSFEACLRQARSEFQSDYSAGAQSGHAAPGTLTRY